MRLLRVLFVGLLMLGAAACDEDTPFDPTMDIRYKWILQNSLPTASSWRTLRNVEIAIRGGNLTGFSPSTGQTVTADVFDPQYESGTLRLKLIRESGSLNRQEGFIIFFEGRMHGSDRVTGRFFIPNPGGQEVPLTTGTLVRAVK